MSRRTAREVAMKLAFANLFGCEDTYEAVLEKSGIDEKPGEQDVRFAEELLEGIKLNADEIDAKIEELAIDWTVERMPRVDLSILRVAIYEICYRQEIPSSVSINEAVELAKQFGGENSAPFINGLLGALVRRMES